MKFPSIAVAAVTGIILGSPAAAQDPLKSNPAVYAIVLENASVRVLRVSLDPGVRTAWHDHPDAVIVPLSSARVRFTGADGKAVESMLQAEQPIWMPTEKHTSENLDKTSAELVLVELMTTA